MENSFDRLIYLYQFVDRTMTSLAAGYPDEIVCRKGCNDCCNAVFDLSFIEALYLRKRFKEVLPEVRQKVLDRCRKAEKEWQDIFREGNDLSAARLRCPLLNDEGGCSCYEARPVNCRTYGVPTIINGAAHVCGLSNFAPGKSYPSIDLAPLQKSLYEYSIAAGGPDLGNKRLPIARILPLQEKF